ncbi:MAG: hypothetical protein FJ388_15250 [Verrucomicrobia bacterium]|nr:hypothetical protein [Verrucomicrobiota bacterium]
MILIATTALSIASAASGKSRKPDPGASPANPNVPAGIKWTGEITSISHDKLIIRGNTGGECEFIINTETQFGRDKAQTVADFKKGEKVLVICIEVSGRRVARQVTSVRALSKKALDGARSP